MKNLRRRLSPANVLSCLALFVALGGAAYAAALPKNAVKSKNIAKGAVTTPKLKNGAVTATKLKNNAVIGPKIANEAVGSSKLGAASVRSVALGGGVVTTAKLKDGAVSTNKIQDGAVTGAKLAASIVAQLVKNVTYVTKSSSTDSSSPKTVTADCPAGKEAIAGGAKLILGSATKVAQSDSSPTPPDANGKRTGWEAGAYEVENDAESWAVEAVAVCAEF